MLFGKQRMVKEAFNADKTFILQLVDNVKNFQLNTHINFETNLLARGTLEEMELMYTQIVAEKNLTDSVKFLLDKNGYIYIEGDVGGELPVFPGWLPSNAAIEIFDTFCKADDTSFRKYLRNSFKDDPAFSFPEGEDWNPYNYDNGQSRMEKDLADVKAFILIIKKDAALNYNSLVNGLPVFVAEDVIELELYGTKLIALTGTVRKKEGTILL